MNKQADITQRLDDMIAELRMRKGGKAASIRSRKSDLLNIVEALGEIDPELLFIHNIAKRLIESDFFLQNPRFVEEYVRELLNWYDIFDQKPDLLSKRTELRVLSNHVLRKSFMAHGNRSRDLLEKAGHAINCILGKTENA